ncbi:CLUMA_CG021365, isoform A [Clunio marinus]|uniref:CLUMA_CG021365, isoform A n=1 Tax=Clunio marinus TaxID=568069 RepID=A0A1J1J811_9DIPT|nr:CLUMA_CG021365, isoform A [Clunio marinus]
MILIVLFLSYFSTSSATFCSSPDENTLYIYPSEYNCSTFIACINSEEFEFECIQAPRFIQWSEKAICMQSCLPVESTPKHTEQTILIGFPADTILYPDIPARSIICPPLRKTKAIIPETCTSYLDCNDGIAIKTECPVGEQFSPTQYECVPEIESDCHHIRQQGLHHIKCRYDKGLIPLYFESDSCPVFKKCANKLAWEVECARDCHWDNDNKICDWADNFECNLLNN